MPKARPQADLSIGELARETGASLRSIRHYDDHRLLSSVRAENGYRVFSALAVTQVRQIQRLMAQASAWPRSASFPIACG